MAKKKTTKRDLTSTSKEKVEDILQKYPPRKTNKIYVRMWNEFVDGVASRDNFKLAYLNQLSILCDLYVEYDTLLIFIQKNGYSYESESKSGITLKPYPEVLHFAKVQSEIRNYSKILGLLLVKDTSQGDPKNPKGPSSEWD